MEEGMTREVFEEKLANWADHRWTGDADYLLILAHDAALRAALEQVAKGRDELQQHLNICHGIINAQETTLVIKESRLTDLESQMTNRRTGFSPYIRQLEAELIEAKDRTIPALQQQLVAAQARIEELEQQWHRAATHDADIEGP